MAVFTAFTMLFQGVFPYRAMALTGGPSQPEVQSFEPVGTSDMVDLFSGDFNYNIPLMDVDGYPINISYHSGITMDQEASWVGLGWNINPGVINRGVRGIPDDFDGDQIVHELNMKPNKTYGLTGAIGLELLGIEGSPSLIAASAGYSMGIKYNNYTGLGIEQSFNIGIESGNPGKGPLSGGLGLNVASSSDEGLSISPSASFGARLSNTSSFLTTLGLSVGCSFNSRAGLKNMTCGVKLPFSLGSGEVGAIVNELTDVHCSFNLGMPTYTPQVTMPMHNIAGTGSFKLGLEYFTAHPNFTISGYYSEQRLTKNSITNNAYGYMNLDDGENNENAILDFNREKDGPFTPNTPDLPVTNLTYDVFSVSGQGVGGSYRAFRSDMGHVFDASASNTSDSWSVGGEVGLGDLFHAGLDVSTTDVNTHSGRWHNENPAATYLQYKAKTGNSSYDPLYEKYYFKEASEKSVDSDPSFLTKAGGYDPVRINLDANFGKFNIVTQTKFSDGTDISPNNYRQQREKRSQPITVLTRKELDDGFGIQPADPALSQTGTGTSDPKEHHIAEITTLNTNGARYIYGIAAYNTRQEETTFNINPAGRDATKGLVQYAQGTDNNVYKNKQGQDYYFNNTITPAYAHSYLLTSVLSPDYVDADGVPGPSDGDLGSYTKFSYQKISGYKWRVPFALDSASYNEGLKSINYDDKGNYLYGEKDLWYMDTIQTKNYIAIFTLEPRKDGYGVNDHDGGICPDASKAMLLLRKISLYSKIDYYKNKANAVPIKEVHFEYDYSLCPNVPNNSGAIENDSHGNNINVNKGKLTLKKIYFTYENSKKARLSPYVFTYSSGTENPHYNLKNYDRWGNYKEQNASAGYNGTDAIPNAEFPYVEQDSAKANESARAWSLTTIGLPSGGEINVNYEADDYAYVQNKQAMQMFKICNIGTTGNLTNNTDALDAGYVSKDMTGDPVLYFKLSTDESGHSITDINKYFNGADTLYFRFLMQVMPVHKTSSPPSPGYEYVSGYVTGISNATKGVIGNYGYLNLAKITINDGGPTMVCPIVKAAVQYGRLNLSREVWGDDSGISDGLTLKDVLEKITNSSFAHNISQAMQGPNKALFTDGVGNEAVMNKSWIRLNNVTGHKYGGGSRVNKITISDEWGNMGSGENTYNYGQEYTYTNDDGTSSGVACYEPQIGGDENPWRTPVFFDNKNLLAPDDQHYMETPFGESFFPSPSVGYSKVTVKNLKRMGVNRNATGSVVHEFYTAKDFPTIVNRTQIDPKRSKSPALSLGSLLSVIDEKDYMTASQGYVIELNDMHGKPKGQKVYQEGQTSPISSVLYKYKSTPYLNNCSRLDNTATVINSSGVVDNTATIGVFFDFVSDMREESTISQSSGRAINVDCFLFPFPPWPVPIPVVLPSSSKESTQYRSAVVTKVIQRFGLLDETIATDLGSTVATKNVAYDSETGDVLLTQTTTDFNDAIYSLTFPAYWYYDGMGAAYKNVGLSTNNITFSNGFATVPNADMYFCEGDELEMTCMYNGNEVNETGWVTEVLPTGIKILDKQGNDLSKPGLILTNPFASTAFSLKILRSGRRNQQSTPMASLTTRSNPLNGVQSNLYDKVLQAGASEFTNNWRTFCDCFATSGRGKNAGSSLVPIFTTNPFILGTKGMWKLKTSYLYLSDRTQTNYNNNTNIRTDGMFTSFMPYYKFSSGKWAADGKNWTYTSNVTEFSPFGSELENQDALGRYSTALYGYNQSMATAVAANARYREVGVDNFEDYGFSSCADNHFKFNKDQQPVIDNTVSHTGTNSLKVGSASAVTMTKQLAICDSSTCTLTLSLTQQSNQYTITVLNGAAPYVFDWNVSVGDVNISLGIDGKTLIYPKPVTAVTIDVTVTDIHGCGVIKHIKCDGSNCGMQ
jgi:hypothetical protein